MPDSSTPVSLPRSRRPPAPSPPDLVPRQIGGRYRIDSVLGRGGWGVVYAAHDLVLGRAVALKRLRLDKPVPPSLLVEEAKQLAAVRHTNVVTLYGLETGDDGAPFLVLEKVSGSGLDSILDPKPSLAEGLWLLRQAAAGLDAIHAAGVVHGDVKPSNVLIDKDGGVKIADFGLSGLFGTMEEGEVIGTPAYLPPERALGLVPDPATAFRGDIYSFGVLAMELLAGRAPFETESVPKLIAAHAYDVPRRPSQVSELSRAFDEPIGRALSKRPSDRPASCMALVGALERAAHGTDAEGRPLRILLADDDPDLRLMISHGLALRLRGAVIETVSDGDLALESIRIRPPTVAILDLVMPGLAGTALVTAIRDLAPEVAVFVLTGSGSGAEWRVAKSSGVSRFFIKPAELDDVAAAIRDVVRRSERRTAGRAL